MVLRELTDAGSADEAAPPRRLLPNFALSLESPALTAPAVALILVGVFLPLGVLAIYSLWPTVDQEIVREWTLDNYQRFLIGGPYVIVLARSLLFAGLASAIAVIASFPFAYFVATKVPPERRMIWVLIAVLPFFSSYLIRVLAWMMLLGDAGIINHSLMNWGLISEPLDIFGRNTSGIVITFAYLLFPLTFLTSFITLERSNPTLVEASADLGARPWQSMMQVILPIARTGLLGGFIFSMITILGDYVTPRLIGGTQGYMYSTIIQMQFGASVQLGFGSALALVLIVLVFALLLILRWGTGGSASVGTFTRAFNPKPAPVLRAYSLLFLAFLYAPVALLFIVAVNARDSIGFPFVGFTLQWFAVAFSDSMMMRSLFNSLMVATISVVISVVLGTVAAVQLSRSRGKLRQANMAILSLPLFLPPMLLGLGLIIGLNLLGIDRGMWTIIFGHTLLSLPIVTLLVLMRLEGIDPNLELAAMDLGASPMWALLLVTAPQALPGIVAAALICFAMSMDEFILTALVTGSDSTLPLYVFGQLRFRVSPAIAAISAVLLAASFLMILIGAFSFNAGRKRGSASAGTVPTAS